MITFSSSNGCCPSYMDYYIGDRLIGRDAYGHESYQYALFRLPPTTVEATGFGSYQDACLWLIKKEMRLSREDFVRKEDKGLKVAFDTALERLKNHLRSSARTHGDANIERCPDSTLMYFGILSRDGERSIKVDYNGACYQIISFPLKRKQYTGWYDSYQEALASAKETVARLEKVQPSLFEI